MLSRTNRGAPRVLRRTLQTQAAAPRTLDHAQGQEIVVARVGAIQAASLEQGVILPREDCVLAACIGQQSPIDNIFQVDGAQHAPPEA